MNFGTKVTVRRSVFTVKKITRIEIGGPVGSGKLRWWKRLPPLTGFGIKVLVIANDVVTTEDAKHVQRTLKASCSRSESSA